MTDRPSGGPATVGALVVETERLGIHRWTAATFDALLAVYGDADSMRWVGDGEPMGAEEGRRWIDVTLANYERRGYGMFELRLREDAASAGFMGLVHPQDQPEAELKYALSPSWRGRGLATEAGRGLLSWAARVHGITEVIATLHPDNLASRAVVARLGFRRGADRIEDDGTVTHVHRWGVR